MPSWSCAHEPPITRRGLSRKHLHSFSEKNCYLNMLQLFSTERGKVVPVYAMKAFKGSRGIAILIHNLGKKWSWVHQNHAPAIYLQGRIMVPIKEESGRAPEPLWMKQRREKSLASVEIWTLDIQAHSLVTILIVLYWLTNLNWCKSQWSTLLLSLHNTEYLLVPSFVK